jgi:hypothetical protein
MDREVLALWLLLGVAALVQAVLLGLHSMEHLRYARRRVRKVGRLTRVGRAAVIVPCKGLDLGLAENLRPLFEQDYHKHRIVFVVGTADDPACEVIRRLIDDHPATQVQLLIAGRATSCGQKIHGLLRAIDELDESVEFLAFLDSDVRPRRDWLRLLLERLDHPPFAGAVTGYRWFVPAAPRLANWMLYSINSTLACLFTAQGQHLVWGGSWAIRRDVFEAIGMREAWQHQLSDDLVAARVLHTAGLRVKFEPACVVASPIDMTLAGGFAFLRRQYLLARLYMPRWWLGLLGGTLLATLGFWLAVGLTIAGCFGFAACGWWPPTIAAAIMAAQGYRGLIRGEVARICLPEQRNPLRIAAWFDLVSAPFAGLFSLAALIASSFGRRVAWRGIEYKFDGRGNVLSVSHPATDSSPAAIEFDPQTEYAEPSAASRYRSPVQLGR